TEVHPHRAGRDAYAKVRPVYQWGYAKSRALDPVRPRGLADELPGHRGSERVQHRDRVADGAAAGADGRGGGAPYRREEGSGVHDQPRAAVRAGQPDTDRGLTPAEWLARCMDEAGVGIEIWRRLPWSGRLARGVKGELAE